MGEVIFLCFYEYRGQETEGNTAYWPKFVCTAVDEAEALWKYTVWLHYRQDTGKPYFGSLEEYRKGDYASGGWGFYAYRLDESQKYTTNDNEYFMKFYEKWK